MRPRNILLLVSFCIVQFAYSQSNVGNYFNENQFNTFFPYKNNYTHVPGGEGYNLENKTLFTYTSFIQACNAFPEFAGSNSHEINRRELAAFLAQASYYTNDAWSSLTYVDGSDRYKTGFMKPFRRPYKSAIVHSERSEIYPAKDGISYHPRGLMGIEGNYLYGKLSEYLYGDKNILLDNPDLIFSDGVTFFKAALWQWMTPLGRMPSCHQVMTDNSTITPEQVTANKWTAGFGLTTNILAGDVEGGLDINPEDDDILWDLKQIRYRTIMRIGFYKKYCTDFGVLDASEVTDCNHMKPITKIDLGLIPVEVMRWEDDPRDAGWFYKYDFVSYNNTVMYCTNVYEFNEWSKLTPEPQKEYVQTVSKWRIYDIENIPVSNIVVKDAIGQTIDNNSTITLTAQTEFLIDASSSLNGVTYNYFVKYRNNPEQKIANHTENYTFSIQKNGLYSIRLQAVNADGFPGEYSETIEFNIAGLENINPDAAIEVTIDNELVTTGDTRYLYLPYQVKLSGKESDDVDGMVKKYRFTVDKGSGEVQLGEYSTLSATYFTIENTGTYTFNSYVLDNNSGEDKSDDVTLIVNLDDYSDELQNAATKSVTDGMSVSAQFEEGEDVDIFKFTVSNPGTYTFLSTGSFDTYGTLFNDTYDILFDNDNGGSGNNYNINRYLDAGTYYLKTENRGNSTGNYSINVTIATGDITDDYANTIDSAEPITINSVKNGVIEKDDDIDCFKVTLTEKGRLRFYTSGDIYTKCRVEDSNGVELYKSDNESGNLDIERFLEAGIYYIKLGIGDYKTGNYVLMNSFTPDDYPNTQSEAAEINIGEAINGNFEGADDKDLFKVNISKTGKLNITRNGSLNIYAKLFDEEGSELTDVTLTSSGNLDLWVESGNYFFQFSVSESNTGNYSFTTTLEDPDESKTVFDYLTEELYNEMFPKRNGYARSDVVSGPWTNIPNQSLFDYQNLVDASEDPLFKKFSAEGTIVQRLQELAAFLANMSHETTGGWEGAPGGRDIWGFVFPAEVAWKDYDSEAANAQPGYVSPSAEYPPADKQSYHGRGPIQLSWNYNYGQCSKYIYGDVNTLLQDPDRILTDGKLFFQTALWFWMVPQGKKPSCHGAMIDRWDAEQEVSQEVRDFNKLHFGFGLTINIINGGLESGPSNLNHEGPDDREHFYLRYCKLLGVSPGKNLSTREMTPFNGLKNPDSPSGGDDGGDATVDYWDLNPVVADRTALENDVVLKSGAYALYDNKIYRNRGADIVYSQTAWVPLPPGSWAWEEKPAINPVEFPECNFAVKDGTSVIQNETTITKSASFILNLDQSLCTDNNNAITKYIAKVQYNDGKYEELEIGDTPYNYNVYKNGSYTFKFKIIDEDEYPSFWQTVTFEVKGLPNVLPVSVVEVYDGDNLLENGSTIFVKAPHNIRITAEKSSDEDGKVFEYQHFVNDGTGLLNINSYQTEEDVTYTITSFGDIVFKSRVKDNNGGESDHSDAITIHVKEDDHANVTSGATNHELNSMSSNMFEYASDIDMFLINISEEGKLIINSTGDINTYAELTNNKDQLLSVDDNSGLDKNFKISRALKPGAYYLSVKSADNEIKDYNLVVSFIQEDITDDYGNSRSGAHTATIGEVINGSIEIETDVDYFKFDLSEKGALIVEAEGDLDTKGILMDSGGEVIKEDTLGGTAKNVAITQFLDAGTYYFSLSIEDLITGNYQLISRFNEDDYSNTTDGATVLQINTDLNGVIDYKDDVDCFEVNISADGLLNIPEGELIYTLLQDNYIHAEGKKALKLWLEPGKYYLKVTKPETGNYTINFNYTVATDPPEISELITASDWIKMFPNLNAYGIAGKTAYNFDDVTVKDLFKYDNFINAVSHQKYSRFASEGSVVVRLRELAAFLANTSHETTGGWGGYEEGAERYNWGYVFPREVAAQENKEHYTDNSNTNYPPSAGKYYYGRGPIQLSWNYNYGQFSQFFYDDKTVLLNDPDKVLNEGPLFFQSAMWFWMTPQGKKPSCHGAVIGNWDADDVISEKMREYNNLYFGFGLTINIINGGLEAGKQSEGQRKKVYDRIGFYKHFCKILNVSPGENLDVLDMNAFTALKYVPGEGGGDNGGDGSEKDIVDISDIPKISEITAGNCYKGTSGSTGDLEQYFKVNSIFYYDQLIKWNWNCTNIDGAPVDGDNKYYKVVSGPITSITLNDIKDNWAFDEVTINTDDFPDVDLSLTYGENTISNSTQVDTDEPIYITIKPTVSHDKDIIINNYFVKFNNGEYEKLDIEPGETEAIYKLIVTGEYKIKYQAVDADYNANSKVIAFTVAGNMPNVKPVAKIKLTDGEAELENNSVIYYKFPHKISINADASTDIDGTVSKYAFFVDDGVNLVELSDFITSATTDYVIEQPGLYKFMTKAQDNDEADSDFSSGVSIEIKEEDHGNIPDNATVVTIGNPIDSRFEYNNDIDYFKVIIPNTANYIIKTTGATDVVATLIQGEAEIYNDDNSGAGNNIFMFQKLDKGVYYVKLSEASGLTGDYVFSISENNDNTDIPDPQITWGSEDTYDVIEIIDVVNKSEYDACWAVLDGKPFKLGQPLFENIFSDHLLEIYTSKGDVVEKKGFEFTVTPKNYGNKKFIAYYPTWMQYKHGKAKFTPDQINPHLYTHIVYAFLDIGYDVNSAGKPLEPYNFQMKGWEWNDFNNDSGTENGMVKRINDLKSENPELKLLASVGGWTFNDPKGREWIFTTICSKKEYRDQFITMVINFCRDKNFDGIDMDWEYPGLADRNATLDADGNIIPNSSHNDFVNFALLLKEMSEAFEEEAANTGNDRLTLSIAVGINSSKNAGYDYSEIKKYVDWIGLMSYDYNGAWNPVTGAQAPLFSNDNMSVDATLKLFTTTYGIPENKLVLGLACYGRGWSGVSQPQLGASATGPSPATLYINAKGSIAFYEARDFITSGDGTVRYWDAASKTPFIHNSKTNVLFSYDDEASLHYKMKHGFTEYPDLAGVMFWDMTQDNFFDQENQNSLQTMVKRHFTSDMNMKPVAKFILKDGSNTVNNDDLISKTGAFDITIDASSTVDAGDVISKYIYYHKINGETEFKLIGNQTGSSLNYNITNNGTHYFAVRAEDDEGLMSDMSLVKKIIVNGLDNNNPVATMTVKLNSEPLTDGQTLRVKLPATITIDASESADDDGTIVEYTYTVDGTETKSAVSGFSFEATEYKLYNIKLKVLDNYSGESTEKTISYTLTENTKPVAAIKVKRDGAELANNDEVKTESFPVTFTVDASESSDSEGAVQSYLFFVNGVQIDDWGTTATKSIDINDYNTYIFSVLVKDEDGLESDLSSTISLNVTEDNPKPEAVLIVKSDGSQLAQNDVVISETLPVSIELDASGSTDNNSVSKYRYYVNGESVTDWVDENKHTYSATTYGDYIVKVKVKDDQDKESEFTGDFTFKVAKENEKPVAIITVKYNDSEISDNQKIEAGTLPVNVELDASGSTDDSEVKSYKFYVDGTAVTDWVTDSKYTHSITSYADYIVKVKVKDDADEESLFSSEIEFTIANVNEDPEAKLVVKHNANQVNSGDIIIEPALPVNIVFDASTSTDDSGVSEYRYFVDGTAVTNWVTNNLYTHSVTEYGEYTIKLKVKDDTGKESEFTEGLSFKIKAPNVKPVAQLNLYKSTDEISNNQVITTENTGVAVTLNATNSSDSDGDVAQYRYYEGSTVIKDWTTDATFDYTLSAFRSYAFKVVVKDNEDLESDESAVVNVKLNKKPEAVVSLYKGSTALSDNSVINFETGGVTVKIKGDNSTDDATISEYLFNVNDTDLDNWSSSAEKDYTITASGTYTFKLKVKDNDGAISEYSTEMTLVVNALPLATLSLTYDGNALTNNQLLSAAEANHDIVITANGTDSDGTITQYRFIVNDVVQADWQDNQQYTHNISSFGTYAFRVQVKDNQGAVSEESAKTTIKLNKIPIAGLTLEYDSNTLLNNGVIEVDALPIDVILKGSGSTDDGTVSKYNFYVNDISKTNWQTESDYTLQITEYSNYKIELKVNDNDNVNSEISEAIIFTVKAPEANAAPITRFKVIYDNDALSSNDIVTTSSENVILKLDASESTDPDDDAIEYKFIIDGQEPDSWQQDAVLNFTTSGFRTYTFKVKTKDSEGNEGSFSETITVKLNSKPTAVIEMKHNNEGLNNNHGFNVSNQVIIIQLEASQSSDQESSTLLYMFNINGTDTGTWQADSDFGYSLTNSGSYVFRVKVKDEDGGVSDLSAIMSVTINKIPVAKVRIKSDGEYLPNGHILISNSPEHIFTLDAGESTDVENNITKYKFYRDDEVIADWRTNPRLLYPVSEFGEYRFYVQVKDDYEAESERSEVAAVRVDKRVVGTPPNPKITVTYDNQIVVNNQKINLGDGFSISVNAIESFDPDGFIEKYKLFVNSQEVTGWESEPKFNYEINQQGDYSVQIQVKDDDNNISELSSAVKFTAGIFVSTVEMDKNYIGFAKQIESVGDVVYSRCGIVNTGGYKVTITEIGSVAYPFTISHANLPYDLEVGETLWVDIEASLDKAGEYVSTFTVKTAVNEMDVRAYIRVYKVNYNITLSPSAISYGNIVDEAALNPVKVVVSNNDDNAIELVSVEYPDKPFLISNIPQLPYVIKANSSFEFNVHIQDVAEGFKADSVVFTYSKGKSYVPLDVLKISPTFSDDEDADNSEYITIYPNPFGDSFIIDINRDYTEATIKIYDSNSRIVYNQRFDSQNSIKLSGLNISPGIYVVEIIIDGKVFKKIVIKV
jgi:GH18 family chitinase/predicted chitinase